MARRNQDLTILDTVTGRRLTVTPSASGAFVNRRRVPKLPPELYHVASAFERNLYCVDGDRWDATDLVNFLEPEVLGQITGTFLVDHWRLEDEALANLSVPAILFPGNCYVRAFHDAVDPLSRVCQHCGIVVGEPPTVAAG